MSREGETYDLSLLELSKRKWIRSPALRQVYSDIFAEMAGFVIAGDSLEVGSGIGSMKEILPAVVTSDVEKTPYVDEQLSCYELAESGRDWANILAVDVLHHLRFPMRFFESAAGSLKPGGRVILNEPAATLGGRLFYRMFHHEPCRPSSLRDPFVLEPDDEKGNFANMGMGIALFVNHREWVEDELAKLGMRLIHLRYRDLLAYPASGGFSKPSLLPVPLLRIFLAMEKRVPQSILSKLALRMTIVLEKKP